MNPNNSLVDALMRRNLTQVRQALDAGAGGRRQRLARELAEQYRDRFCGWPQKPRDAGIAADLWVPSVAPPNWLKKGVRAKMLSGVLPFQVEKVLLVELPTALV